MAVGSTDGFPNLWQAGPISPEMEHVGVTAARSQADASGGGLVVKPACHILNGGEEGIRTLEKLLTSTPLAGARLRPLGHLSGRPHNPVNYDIQAVSDEATLLRPRMQLPRLPCLMELRCPPGRKGWRYFMT